ncbi:hypothetical protein [Geodermatophilus chilensis]|uniref:hypothetical protein n=1 Tax=Geodermatophilus chilensis TaxID=2035835 RepID=UPI000C269FD5|nr:hypothetical protein [Geodermatophilus chilensis]
MGTSGAYGGSGSASWDDAHDLYQQVTSSSPGSAGPSTSQLVTALAAALRRANGDRSADAGAYSATGTARVRGLSADGYTRSRTSGGSAGGFVRRAARGAAAVGGAQAYRARDGQALTDLGLDLAALDALPSDRDRCVAIADALLGAPAHPDDAALKAAAIQTMMDALRSKDEFTSEQLIENFTANLTYEQVLVELTSQRRTTAVPAAQAAKTEKRIKKYIRTSVRTAGRAVSRRLDLQGLIDRATSLAARVLGIFGQAT